MKKLLSMILVLAMALSLMCGSFVSAYADEEFEEEAVAAAPIAESEEDLELDGKTTVTTVTFSFEGGVLSVVSADDETGATLGASDFELTDNGDGSYKIKMVDSDAYSLSTADFGPASIGTFSAREKGENRTLSFTFTPAEGGEETGGEAGGEETGGEETGGGSFGAGAWAISNVEKTHTLINNDGTADGVFADYDIGNPRASITATAVENGFDLVIGDSTTGYLAVSDGKLVTASAANGSWNIINNHLVFSNPDQILYLSDWDTLAMSADEAEAIEVLVEAYTGSSGGGGGSGGGSGGGGLSRWTLCPGST